MPTGGETAPSSIVFPTPSSTQFSSASQTPATTMVITSTVIVTAPTAATVTVTRTTSTTTLFTTAFVTVGPTPPPVYEICQPGNYLQDFNGLFLSSTSSLLETQPYPDVTTAEECCVACQEDSSCNLNYWNQVTRECVGLYETNPETCDVQVNGGTAFADSETTSTTIIVSNGRCGRWTAAQQGQ
ncbi:hypothetical protein Micbo1qcDRAFT_158492 [Microdochium bolleyi]|uniref:Apple domain-containing protein n=1 Tax=Microdochium bolleyi TaxID=196109 RepID=A0A136JGJ2_9PEZI|nr:hypothetical protein Micbo1qcDRAFT_158492 [Microdochium bolleyi]